MTYQETLRLKHRNLTDWLQEGLFFTPASELAERFCYVEANFENALAVAHWRSNRLPPEGWPEVIDWSDKCESECAGVNDLIYELPNYTDLTAEVRLLGGDLDVAVTDAFARNAPALIRQAPELLDEVSYHLSAILRASLVDEGRRLFFDRLELAYKLGAWPCGWVARSGAEDLLVFSYMCRTQLSS